MQSLFFSAEAAGTGREFYVANIDGITPLGDLNPGEGDGDFGSIFGRFDATAQRSELLFFVADDGVTGAELYVTDGTAAGTRRLIDLNPGAAGSTPDGLVNVDNRIFFIAETEATGREIFVSDGTPQGTRLVRDLQPGERGGLDPALGGNVLVPIGDGVLFAGNDGNTNTELYFSDGTAEGTRLVLDIAPGVGGSGVRLSPGGTLDDGRVVFFAGSEVWITDATAEGTRPLAETSGTSNTPRIETLATAGDRVFFAANTPETGYEPWVSDGTPGGTFRIADLNGTDRDSVPRGDVFFGVEDGVVFRAEDPDVPGDNALFATSGNIDDVRRLGNAGTTLVDPDDIVDIGDRALFTAIEPEAGRVGNDSRQLFVTDGTTAGTSLVEERTAASMDLLGVDGFAFAEDTATSEILRTDGESLATVADYGAAGLDRLSVELIAAFDIRPPGTGLGLSEQNARLVAYLYEAGLDRDGDIDLPGLNFWIDQVEAGLAREALAEFFLASPEFEAAAEGEALDESDPAYLDDVTLVTELYENVLDRAFDEPGRDFWLSVLQQPGFSRSELLLEFALSEENVQSSTFVETLSEVSAGEWDFAA